MLQRNGKGAHGGRLAGSRFTEQLFLLLDNQRRLILNRFMADATEPSEPLCHASAKNSGN